jgi:hypothetical protein
VSSAVRAQKGIEEIQESSAIVGRIDRKDIERERAAAVAPGGVDATRHRHAVQTDSDVMNPSVDENVAIPQRQDSRNGRESDSKSRSYHSDGASDPSDCSFKECLNSL